MTDPAPHGPEGLKPMFDSTSLSTEMVFSMNEMNRKEA